MNLPSPDKMIEEIEGLKAVVVANRRKLAPFNPQDHYYREILELAGQDYFFETGLVSAWIGREIRPRRVMEIGTRNGGSLVDLLGMYDDYQGLEVVCFDIWREIGSPHAVRRNLRRMNIPTHMIRFVSGSSLETVPKYKRVNPATRFDYILVDGAHDRESARADLENVVDLVAPGGVVVFDDIGPESYQLIDVWRDFQRVHQEKFAWYEKQWRKGVAWAIRIPAADTPTALRAGRVVGWPTQLADDCRALPWVLRGRLDPIIKSVARRVGR